MGFANRRTVIKVQKPAINSDIPTVIKRSQRRSQNKTGFRLTKFRVISLVIAVVLILVGLAILYRNSSPIPLSQTPEISNNIHFGEIVTPDGWTANSSLSVGTRTPRELAQNPQLLESDNNSCSYSRQIFYAPEYQAGRGDDFLTRSSLYQLAETNNVQSPDLANIKVSTDKRPVNLVSMIYDIPSSEKDGVTGKRAIAIRGIDKLIPLDEKTDNKGIPFVSMTYDCKDSKDYDDNEWETLVERTSLSLFSEEPLTRTEEIGK